MFAIWFAFLLMFAFPQQSNPTPGEMRAQAEHDRQQVIELNTLAGNIRSEADARKLVDAAADYFAKDLPPGWITTPIEERLAHAEYAAVSDPAQLIPEQRVADVWNEYVKEIGAPAEAVVTAEEIHWMRDARYAIGQLVWNKWGVGQSVWTMPNLFPDGTDGKVAAGCRPLETLRLLSEMDNLFQNVRNAREGMRKGILTSDRVKKEMEDPNPPKFKARLTASRIDNPIHPAERRYIQEHGMVNYDLLLLKLFNELIPE